MSVFYLLRLVFNFITSSLFKEGELNINSVSFNPVKFMAILVALAYITGSMLVIYKSTTLYMEVEAKCPTIIKRVVQSTDYTKVTCHVTTE